MVGRSDNMPSNLGPIGLPQPTHEGRTKGRIDSDMS